MTTLPEVIAEIKGKLRETELFKKIQPELDEKSGVFTLDFGVDGKRDLSKEVVYQPVFDEHEGFDQSLQDERVNAYKLNLGRCIWNVLRYGELAYNSYFSALTYKYQSEQASSLMNPVTQAGKVIDQESLDLAQFFLETFQKLKTAKLPVYLAPFQNKFTERLDEHCASLEQEIARYHAVEPLKVTYAGQYGAYQANMDEKSQQLFLLEEVYKKLANIEETLQNTPWEELEHLQQQLTLLLQNFEDHHTASQQLLSELTRFNQQWLDSHATLPKQLMYQPLRKKLDAEKNPLKAVQLLKQAKEMELAYHKGDLEEDLLFDLVDIVSETQSYYRELIAQAQADQIKQKIDLLNDCSAYFEWLMTCRKVCFEQVETFFEDEVHQLEKGKLRAYLEIEPAIKLKALPELIQFKEKLAQSVSDVEAIQAQLVTASPMAYYHAHQNLIHLDYREQVFGFIAHHQRRFDSKAKELNNYHQNLRELLQEVSHAIDKKELQQKILLAGQALESFIALRDEQLHNCSVIEDEVSQLEDAQEVAQDEFDATTAIKIADETKLDRLQTELTTIEHKVLRDDADVANFSIFHAHLLKLRAQLAGGATVTTANAKFQGIEWYIPLIEELSFTDIARAMNWDRYETHNWQKIYNQHQAYHRSYLGFSQYYWTDIFKEGSERTRLLREVEQRLAILQVLIDSVGGRVNVTRDQLIQDKQDEIEAFNIEKDQRADRRTEKEEALTSVTKDLEDARDRYQQSKQEADRLSLICEIRQHAIDLKSLSEYQTRWAEIIETKPLISEDMTIKDKFTKVEAYFLAVQNFSSEFFVRLADLKFDILTQQLEAQRFARNEEDDCYLDLVELHTTMQELLKESNKEMETYQQLHAENLKEYQQQLAVEQFRERTRQELHQQEVSKRQINVDKYLDLQPGRAGVLTNYLQQRAETYWFRDLVSSFFAFFLKWPFGYQTEKERREKYVNKELRPAIESYKRSGDNSDLLKVLDPQYTFFKPRTRDNIAYSFTLSFLIEGLRQELLTKSQIKTYETQSVEQPAVQVAI